MKAEMRRPEWLRKETALSPSVVANRARIAESGLHTVCESARCPNMSECFKSGNATFLIMGDHCTRGCAFCAVGHGAPLALDAEEGVKIARHMLHAGIRYAVLTSVTRDDLVDGGAAHFSRVVRDIRAVLPEVGLELLVPDFQGRKESTAEVVSLPIEVFAHNLETTAPHYAAVRRGADYRRSLEVLRSAGAMARGRVLIKTGIMVGLGESDDECAVLFDDCAEAGVDILTIGQYLRPSWRNVPVARYLRPGDFELLAETARRAGVRTVQAGPYVRSSYLAEAVARSAVPEKDLTRGTPGNIISSDSDTE
jgi:lipoyl synthase